MIAFAKQAMKFHTGYFVVVNVDSFQLEVRVSMIGSGWVNTMLV